MYHLLHLDVDPTASHSVAAAHVGTAPPRRPNRRRYNAERVAHCRPQGFISPNPFRPTEGEGRGHQEESRSSQRQFSDANRRRDGRCTDGSARAPSRRGTGNSGGRPLLNLRAYPRVTRFGSVLDGWSANSVLIALDSIWAARRESSKQKTYTRPAKHGRPCAYSKREVRTLCL